MITSLTFLNRPGSFYRQAVPEDIVDGAPSPSGWGPPVAELLPSGCDPIANFVNLSIIFGKYFAVLIPRQS